ncbi:MAG: deoxyribodipyrimidine photo-lyase [Pseudomonadota bacterium]
MSTVLFWFRHDLRLDDQRALQAACAADTRALLPVYCLPDNNALNPWGFSRIGPHRRAWLAAALQDLAEQLQQLGCPLLICPGPAASTLPRLAHAIGASHIVCETIAAPEEQAEISALRAAGLEVRTVWHSSLLDPAQLPWPIAQLPTSFTPFRQAIERAQITPPAPLPAPRHLPPWPTGVVIPPQLRGTLASLIATPDVRPYVTDPRSSLPHNGAAVPGGASAGQRHLAQYLARQLPHRYKQTRNDLMGVDYSSKCSPWLSSGALSARRIMAELRQFEATHGANDGSYWLWFELLWRDYFRCLHLRYTHTDGASRRLYRAQGLTTAPVSNATSGTDAIARWCQARTGQPLIDAGLRELNATGYLSNRLRQVVASYWVYDLGGDWRTT